MGDKQTKDVKAQAEKLERYINQFATRSVNVADALGSKGCKMLSDLLEKVDALTDKYPYIGIDSNYGSSAVFYGPDIGNILHEGSSWLRAGTKVKEAGFKLEQQI